ncbi:MAG: hypothetical protein JXQ87_19740, partial [Bacteroidia bacterium]
GNTALTNNSVCDPAAATGDDYNGAITFTPTGGGTNYKFALETSGGTALDGLGNATTANAAPHNFITYTATATTTTTVNGLPAGSYVMTITDDDSECPIEHPFTIANDFTTNIHTVAEDITDVTDNTGCALSTYDGQVDASTWVTPADNGTTITYSYSWATSADPSTEIDDSAVLDQNQITGSNNGVIDGTYILTVTRNETGCSVEEEVTICTSW